VGTTDSSSAALDLDVVLDLARVVPEDLGAPWKSGRFSAA
jgi:hypothetical protein